MGTKTIRAAIAAICVAAALPSYADTNITEYVKLTEDADWSSLGTVNIAAGAGIHLNGRNLTVSGFSGSGSFYSSAVLPAGYAVLEYVDSTGAQYIDTGIAPTAAAKVDAEVAYIGGTANAYEALLCSSVSDVNNTQTAKCYGLWVWPNSGNKWSVMFNGTTYNSSAGVANGTKCHLVAAWSETARTLMVDGTSQLNNTKKNTPTSTSNTMYMPAWNGAGIVRNMGKFRFYSVKIYNPQNALKRNYVPAKRLSDDVAGFYDMVSKTFFPSETETAFVEGPEVERSGGELRINVASGTFQNSTVAISNSVKVVKFGAGLYTSSKTQTYTGGTVVSGGKVQSTVEHGFGAAGTAFGISNARVDIEGRNNTLKDYDVTIEDAGTAEVIQGASKITGGSGYQKSFLKSLTLSGDASIGVWQEDAFGLTHNTGSIQPFTLTLNGHTLTIQGNNRLCANRVTVTDEGTINVRRTQGTSNTKLYPRGVFNAPLVTLDIGANAQMSGDEGFVVSNLVFSGTGGSKSTTVLGRYSPKVNSSLPTVVLGDETHLVPTLDIGSVSAAIGGVSFVRNSTVAVDVGSRTVNVGDKLVSWSSQPDLSISFSLTGDGWTAEEREIGLAARGDGLYVKTTAAPVYATLDAANDEWQFFAEDGTPYPDEWTGGVTSDMQVRFSSYEEYTAIKEKGVSPSMFVMTAFAIPENTGEVDASTGLDFQFNDGLVIDVKGNSLKLPSSMMFGDKAFTVTSSVAGGEVVIDVQSGTSRNTSMALSGSLKVTKKGAGTFVSAKAQTYTGGTFVNGGRAQPPDPPSQDSFTYSWDQFKAFGTGDIVVSSNATFDIRANYAYRGIIMLNGGTLTSSGPYDMNSTGSAGSGIGALTADSTLDVVRRMVVGDANEGASFSCDLGGHVLDINLSHGDSHELRLRSALTNGIVRVHGTRVLEIYNALDMSTTTLELGSALKLYATLDLKDYIAKFESPYIAGTGTMNVHGSFRPECDYFYACKMLDGSTLDLSGRTTLFTTTTKSLASGWGPSGTISFASTDPVTTIKVKLGERKVRSGTKVVAWTAKPANNVKFVAADGERRRSFSIKDDGLYVYSGFTIIIK